MTPDPHLAAERVRDTLMHGRRPDYDAACDDLWRQAREWKDDTIGLYPGHPLHPDAGDPVYREHRPEAWNLGEDEPSPQERYA